MLFQSQEFILLFLPVTVMSYYLVAGSAVARQFVLIAASLVFYGWWDARFIPLLVGQIGATWLLARLQQATGRNGFLVFGIIVNLASLATFKYLDFLIGTIEAVARVALPRAPFVLPIGISFFSFQLISYLVDRMRKDAPVYPFRPFALFVLLFPHLIAGPIVRHNELVPQFDEDPRRDGIWARICLGLVLFTVGLAKKVLLADRLAEIADPLFNQAADRWLTFGEAWSATLAFTFQLRDAPRAFTLRTMSCRSPMLRARRSMRVTISTSPLRRNSSTVRNSSRPDVMVPDRFSARMTSQPAARKAACWIERS